MKWFVFVDSLYRLWLKSFEMQPERWAFALLTAAWMCQMTVLNDSNRRSAAETCRKIKDGNLTLKYFVSRRVPIGQFRHHGGRIQDTSSKVQLMILTCDHLKLVIVSVKGKVLKCQSDDILYFSYGQEISCLDSNHRHVLSSLVPTEDGNR